MKKLKIIIYLFFLAYIFQSNVEAKEIKSPDHHFLATVVKGNDGVISYVVTDISNHMPAFTIKSSYQDDNDAWEMSQSVSYYWSLDSQYLVIDEETLRSRGYFLIISFNKGKSTIIQLPTKEIMEKTNLKWEKYTIHTEQGWTSAGDLPVIIGGSAGVTDTSPKKFLVYEVDLKLNDGKVEIIKVRLKE